MSQRVNGSIILTFGLLLFFMFVRGNGFVLNKQVRSLFLGRVTVGKKGPTLGRILLGGFSIILIIGGTYLYIFSGSEHE